MELAGPECGERHPLPARLTDSEGVAYTRRVNEVARVDNRETRIDRLLRWRAGGTAGPWSVSLYPTNRCNFRCPICWQRNPSLKLDHRDEVPDERYLSFVDEAAEAGVREWSILGGGEPLVRGDLVMDLFERIRRRGMSGYIQTNGSLFTRAQLERLVDIGLDCVRVSLDGPNAEVNDAIRNESSFERAASNLKMLAEIKRQKRSAVPAVSLYMVVTSLTYDKLDRMIECASALGASSIEASTMIVHSEEGRPFQLDERQKAELPGHLERAIRRADQLGVQHNFSLFFREDITANPNAMHGRAKAVGSDFFDAPCFLPWLNMVVLYNGSCGPCCMYNSENMSDDNNIGKSSLIQIWQGSYFRQLRARMLEGRMPGYCATCPSTLFAEQDALREEARSLRDQPNASDPFFPNTLLWMARKAVRSARRYGLRGAFRRGIEWARIKRRTKA